MTDADEASASSLPNLQATTAYDSNRTLVTALAAAGRIGSPRVMQAFLSVDRARFLPVNDPV